MEKELGLKSVVRWLAKQNMSQAELSIDLERSRSVVNQWIRGYSHPSVDALQRLSKRTNISMERLLRELPPRTLRQ